MSRSSMRAKTDLLWRRRGKAGGAREIAGFVERVEPRRFEIEHEGGAEFDAVDTGHLEQQRQIIVSAVQQRLRAVDFGEFQGYRQLCRTGERGYRQMCRVQPEGVAPGRQ